MMSNDLTEEPKTGQALSTKDKVRLFKPASPAKGVHVKVPTAGLLPETVKVEFLRLPLDVKVNESPASISNPGIVKVKVLSAHT
jgi:hypothetical protein